jgi:hypothetical protein
MESFVSHEKVHSFYKNNPRKISIDATMPSVARDGSLAANADRTRSFDYPGWSRGSP